ncbi:MAG: Gfo/Idh/MocA family oxidoreductase [Deltaproteobacteria bacterium]|nr:Gfo/Idh/MocA family oxidoreductase [Deltaproteobacteria bacterium]
MEGQVRIAIVGLGRVGSTFIRKLKKFENSGISIVAVLEKNDTSPGLDYAKDKGIPICCDENEIIDMGDNIDIIFNLTGNMIVERNMKLAQVKMGNSHTVIVSRLVAELMWRLITDETLPEHTNIIDG